MQQFETLKINQIKMAFLSYVFVTRIESNRLDHSDKRFEDAPGPGFYDQQADARLHQLSQKLVHHLF